LTSASVCFGEQHLVFAQHRALVQLRLLDLDDHFHGGKYFLRRLDDLRTGRFVVHVRHADTDAGIRLHDDLVAVVHQLAHPRRRHADAELERFDFLRYPYLHVISPRAHGFD
jgi:hypothetical protein